MRTSPRCSRLVQGDTSTTMLQPLDELGAHLREARRAVLHRRHRVARRQRLRVRRVGARCRDRRPAEVPVRTVGLARRSPSDRARRESCSAASTSRPASGRRDTRRRNGPRIRSNYFDLGMILDYWGPRGSTTTPRPPPCSTRRASARASSCGGPPQAHRPARGRRRRHARRARGHGAGVFGDAPQDEQRRRRRDPDGVRRRRGPRRHAERLRHRDRHVVRTAARPRLAHRHHGLHRRKERADCLAALEAVLARAVSPARRAPASTRPMPPTITAERESAWATLRNHAS